MAIYTHSGKSCPSWVEDDEDRGWDAPPPGRTTTAHPQLVRADIDENAADTLRIAYVHKDEEFISLIDGPDTDVEKELEDLIRNVRVPITAVRAYRGKELFVERKLTLC